MSIPTHNGRVIACSLPNLLNLFGESKVEDHADDSCYRKSSLHDKYNSVKEALERMVAAVVGEDIGEIVGYESCAITNCQTSCEDESVSAGERNTFCYDGNSGYSN